MYTKYHQNISKGIRVSEDTSIPLSSSFKQYNLKGQQGRVTILDIDKLSWPDKYAYQTLSKYLEGY